MKSLLDVTAKLKKWIEENPSESYEKMMVYFNELVDDFNNQQDV